MFLEMIMMVLSAVFGNTLAEVFPGLAVFFSVMFIVRLCQWYHEDRDLPPGPFGLPFCGYLPFMNMVDIHLKYAKFAKEFGSMFSVRMGQQLLVVLSDYKLIRECFRREEFTGRPHTVFHAILGGYGVINAEGSLWKEQRKFVHEVLRNFGMSFRQAGRRMMETTIMREVDQFVRGFEATHGAPTTISYALGLSVTNVICSIIMSTRFTSSDLRFKRFMNLIEEGFKLFGRLSYVNSIPVLQWLPWLQTVQKKLNANRLEMADFFQDIINQHRRTFVPSKTRDLIDAYTHEILKAKAEGRLESLFHGKDADRQLRQILGDLFSAGMETVKTTLEWAVILMLHHPEAMRAVQEELDQVVGRDRSPSLEDMQFLPITEATILEVLRRTSIVPLGTAHATTRDVTVRGFKLPKGAHVIPLLHAVHMDEDLWEEPTKFKPSRFLDAQGNVHKPEFFMPFGVGRRMCLGDVLARMELFLFFANILHSFDLVLPAGDSLPSLKGNAGVTVTPDPFRVCLVKRDAEVPMRNVGSK